MIEFVKIKGWKKFSKAVIDGEIIFLEDYQPKLRAKLSAEKEYEKAEKRWVKAAVKIDKTKTVFNRNLATAILAEKEETK